MEEMDGLYFKIGQNHFFKLTLSKLEFFTKKQKELAKITGNDLVYDLYTGTGTIAQYVATTAKKVVGIDSVEEGIKAAYKNAERNNITNCTFYRRHERGFYR